MAGLTSVRGRTPEPSAELFCRVAASLAEHLPLWLLEPGRPAIGFFLRAEVLPEAAEHVREASENVTSRRTLLG